MNLESYIRDVPDFPKEGIIFKDITPLLGDPYAFTAAVDKMVEIAQKAKVEKILGIESRGFIFGAAVAYRMGVGFVPVRKPGKLPFTAIKESYTLEYGTDSLEIHSDAVRRGEKIAIIDDLLATGGTARATVNLARSLDAEIASIIFLVELSFLKGREKLHGCKVHSLLTYGSE